MIRTKKIIMSLILLAGLIAIAYALFAAILISSDHAYYFTSGKNLGEIDYDRIISNAKKAGYTVDGPYYVNTKQKLGLHPDIRELEERLGEDYRIVHMKFYYTKDSGFSAWLPGDYSGETSISFFNESKAATFQLKNLPPDEWITEKFELMFGFDEQKARYHLSQLKDTITGNHEPKILIKEIPDLQTVYTNFKEISSNSTFSLPLGEGSCEETFYSGNEKIGTIDYIVPNTRIIYHDRNHEYTIKIDKLGGVMLSIKLPAGEEIPEEEYRGVFRGMFTNLGLVAKVDDFEFSYSPSMW
ncbi:hypothetical protein DRP05_09140 [Archaeoglobales archaeon]|nr:MAG: hypothetical protein DRP05_09140 [Archaeoglobales archaeon]